MESGRLLQLLWLPLRPPPEGVCVSMLRVLLLRCGGTGGGARCPSGMSCGCRRKKNKKKTPHTRMNEVRKTGGLIPEQHMPDDSQRSPRPFPWSPGW